MESTRIARLMTRFGRSCTRGGVSPGALRHAETGSGAAASLQGPKATEASRRLLPIGSFLQPFANQPIAKPAPSDETKDLYCKGNCEGLRQIALALSLVHFVPVVNGYEESLGHNKAESESAQHDANEAKQSFRVISRIPMRCSGDAWQRLYTRSDCLLRHLRNSRSPSQPPMAAAIAWTASESA